MRPPAEGPRALSPLLALLALPAQANPVADDLTYLTHTRMPRGLSANLSLANAATLEGSVVAKDITLSNAQVLSFEGPQSSPPALTCE